MTFDPNVRPAPDQPSYAALLHQLQEVQSENRQLKRTKKFGLVWEDKPDAQVERVFLEAPLLCEDREKAVVTDEDAVNHVLINGDNFHALTALRATHTGKVDVIYIDPPYNTGNKDFIYNDDYVDPEDGYRHSKWLSFMEKRLRLAKELLSDTGVIFVSIDDNEQARLKLLMDDVFGSDKFLNQFVWVNNLKGRQLSDSGAVKTYESVLAYQKATEAPAFRIDLDKSKKIMPSVYGKAKTYPTLSDEIGEYVIKNELHNTNSAFNEVTSPTLVFNIHYDEENHRVKFSDVNDPVRYDGYTLVPPYRNRNGVNQFHAWRWSKRKIENELDGLHFQRQGDRLRVYTKIRDFSSVALKDIMMDMGAGKLDAILGRQKFNFPKPVPLLAALLSACLKRDSIVLDFFAGSGTTAHAVAELNKADGGRRQCILVTDGGKTEETGHSGSNSNGNAVHIAEEITYERVRRVLTGQDWADGKEHEPLGGNLRYFNVHMEDIQAYSKMDESAAFAPFTRSHASIATGAFTVAEEKRVDTMYGLPNDYAILSAPAGEDEVKYVVAVQAHDYELAELGEWFATLPEDADVTIMGHWLEEVEWIKENSARIKLVDVMEQVSASRKHAKSLVYT